jgi:hypothetical protein
METNLSSRIITETIYFTNSLKSSFHRLNGMCHAFQLGGCECCMHQHTTAQCEPGDCLLLCCSHYCTQHRTCTTYLYLSRPILGLCKLCSEVDAMCEQDTSIRLILTSRRISFPMLLQCHQQVREQSCQDASYASLCSYFRIHSNFNVITEPKGR